MNNEMVLDALKRKGVTLGEALSDTDYIKICRFYGDKFLYISGTGPNLKGYHWKKGVIPKDLSVEEGVECARYAMLNLLSCLYYYLDQDFGRIKQFVKMTVFVSSTSDFTRQHEVANGASEFLTDIFGKEIGKTARSAVGVASLPLGFPLEIEMLVELKESY